MYLAHNKLVFTDGTRMYAFDNIVGITPELEATYGSDGSLEIDNQQLTQAQRVELADHMIGLWTRFKEQKVP